MSNVAARNDPGTRSHQDYGGYAYCLSAGYQLIGPYGGGYDELCGSQYFAGSVSGVVRSGTGAPLPGWVSLCNRYACSSKPTNSLGQFSFGQLPPGSWLVTAFASDGTYLSGHASASLQPNAQVVANVTLARPKLPPSGFDVGDGRRQGGVPVAYGNQRTAIRAAGCASGTATYRILRNGHPVSSGYLFETSFGSGDYMGSAGGRGIAHGAARMEVAIACGGPAQTTSYDFHQLTSGRVTTPAGAPIAGASVTLLSTPTLEGGSAQLSPGNRANPDVTDQNGRFGWDVIAGNYRVRASKPGCHAPGNPAMPHSETSLWRSPPPRRVILRLECPPAPPVVPTPPAPAAPAPPPVPPAGKTASPVNCSLLKGNARLKCTVSQQLKKRLAACRKLKKGSKRRVCERRARALAVCEARKGKQRKACIRRVNRSERRR